MLPDRPRLALARTPTPLVPLPRISAELGLEVWVKRDDQTGLELSGNKVRKLEWLLADAQAQGADTIITCGGVNSNHARATAIAAVQLGLHPYLILRGADRSPPIGNLLLDRYVGAEIEFIDLATWNRREVYLPAVAERLRRAGRRPYVIPEGGSNALGSLGYVVAARELLEQCAAQGLRPTAVVHATGSGGTTAGLALGLASSGVETYGVAVCNDASYFQARIAQILDEAEAQGLVRSEHRRAAKATVAEGLQGRGYGLTTPAEMAQHAALARSEGLLVDPVYTGKAFLGLRAGAEKGRFGRGPVVFLHTGGVFELFAFAAEVEATRPDLPRPAPPTP